MRCTVILELPDEVYQPLVQAAATVSQTPEEWIVASLRRQFVAYDARLRRHFGSVDLGAATGADHEEMMAVHVGPPLEQVRQPRAGGTSGLYENQRQRFAELLRKRHRISFARGQGEVGTPQIGRASCRERV